MNRIALHLGTLMAGMMAASVAVAGATPAVSVPTSAATTSVALNAGAGGPAVISVSVGSNGQLVFILGGDSQADGAGVGADGSQDDQQD